MPTTDRCAGWLVLGGVLGLSVSVSAQGTNPLKQSFQPQPATLAGDPGSDGAPTVVAPADLDALGHGFEVATVKLANRNDGRRWFGTEVAPSGRVTVSAVSLKSLVWYAYVGTQKTGLVEGGPKWAETDEYDIEAKLDESDMAGWDKLSDQARMERVRPQLRALLVERFGLKVHSEMKVTPVYALVQAKGGVKMKEVGAPLGQIGYEIGANDKMMVDETGLDGHYYDFSIKLTKDKEGLTVEQQIEDGLGLRVEERKVPMKTYVI